MDNSVAGDVVLYGFYSDTTGRLVIAKPALVTSRPHGANRTGISLSPRSLKVSTGTISGLQLWATYSDGQEARFYPSEASPPQFSSTNPAVVTVNSGGLITAVGSGTATIRCNYQGLTADAVITVVRDE